MFVRSLVRCVFSTRNLSIYLFSLACSLLRPEGHLSEVYVVKQKKYVRGGASATRPALPRQSSASGREIAEKGRLAGHIGLVFHIADCAAKLLCGGQQPHLTIEDSTRRSLVCGGLSASLTDGDATIFLHLATRKVAGQWLTRRQGAHQPTADPGPLAPKKPEPEF